MGPRVPPVVTCPVVSRRGPLFGVYRRCHIQMFSHLAWAAQLNYLIFFNRRLLSIISDIELESVGGGSVQTIFCSFNEQFDQRVVLLGDLIHFPMLRIYIIYMYIYT